MLKETLYQESFHGLEIKRVVQAVISDEYKGIVQECKNKINDSEEQNKFHFTKHKKRINERVQKSE